MDLLKKVSQQFHTPVMSNGERYALCPITTTDEVVVTLAKVNKDLPPGKSVSLTTLLSGAIEEFSLGGSEAGGHDILISKQFPWEKEEAKPEKKKYSGIWCRIDENVDMRALVLEAHS